MKLSGRTILITGGTSGIGFELASQLLKRGNTVLITGRDRRKLDATEHELDGVSGFLSDVGNPHAAAALKSEILARFPELDVLINNAGIMRNLKLDRVPSPDDLTREIDVNFSGPVRMVDEFLPHLKTRPEALIVNVTSGLAFVPFPAAPVYSATKAALHSYTQSLRHQLEGTRIAVVELAPPGVETPLFRGEFAEEMAGQTGMNVGLLAGKGIAGIEAGKQEIRPGLSNVLKAMSRIAPHFMFGQMANMARPRKRPLET